MCTTLNEVHIKFDLWPLAYKRGLFLDYVPRYQLLHDLIAAPVDSLDSSSYGEDV